MTSLTVWSFAMGETEDCNFSLLMEKYIAEIAGNFVKGAYPQSAVISNTGQLFVTDSRRHCVHVFH